VIGLSLEFDRKKITVNRNLLLWYQTASDRGNPKALFASLEGRVFEKRKEQVEKIENFGRGGLWGVHFSS
jgi:hypothetical protein